jgi:Uma2 family endonuclease
MTTAIQAGEQPVIEYPDDDGELSCDGSLQFTWIARIYSNLDVVFRNDPDVVVAGNLLWYAVEGQRTIRTTPDVMVAFGRPVGRRGSYKQWEEGNIPPQVVFETFSPDSCPVGLEYKFQFYKQYGVEEYYTYDPETGSLEGWLRAGSRLVKVEEMLGYVSPRLRIRFEPGQGPDSLRVFGPDGRLFQRICEIAAEQGAAEKRAEAAERQRAEAECQRAEAERQRADRLAAKLRELGFEPD